MTSTLHETYQAPGGSVAWAPSLVLISWVGSPTLEHAKAIRAVHPAVRDGSVRGVATIALLEGGFPRFSEEVRREVERLTAETEHHSVGSAFVLLQPGFTTAIVQTFLAGIALLTKTKEPVAVFRTGVDAIDWTLKLYPDGPPWSREELTSHLEQFTAPG